MKERVIAKITQNLDCDSLELINESHLHAGHNDFDGTGETHFKLIISCAALNDISRVKAHQKIYNILAEELKEIHAFSIILRKI